jgi:hypothetical protein
MQVCGIGWSRSSGCRLRGIFPGAVTAVGWEVGMAVVFRPSPFPHPVPSSRKGGKRGVRAQGRQGHDKKMTTSHDVRFYNLLNRNLPFRTAPVFARMVSPAIDGNDFLE